MLSSGQFLIPSLPACRHLACIWALLWVAPSLVYAADLPVLPDAASPPTQGFRLPAVSASVQDVLVTEFQFSGNTVIDNATLLDIVHDHIGKRVSYAALEELRTRITRLYVERGYLNSGAVLVAAAGAEPFPGGIVPVRLIEGHIGKVSIKGEGGLAPSYIKRRLIDDAEIFNMPVLQQRFQLLLTDPLFEKINSRVLPSDQPGTAILDIEVGRAKPYSMNLYLNNYRAPSIGSDVAGVAGWVRNLTGYGDMLEANLSHSQGTDPVHLGWNMPLNSLGTTLKLSADQGNSSVVGESLAAVDIQSLSSGYEVGLTQTLVNTLQRKIELGFSYGQRSSQTSLLGEAFSFTSGEPDGYSKIKVAHFTQEWTERWATQALALRSVFAFGRNNIDSGDAEGQVPDQHYRIWTGQLQYVKNLARDGTQIVVRGSVQYTPDNLIPLERFSVGGIATVRGYRENALVRDRAYVLNAEYHYPLLLPGQESGHKIMLVALSDVARANNKGEVAQNLASAGIGLNWQWRDWTADLVWARRLTSLPGQNSGNLQDHGLHLQLSYHLF